MPPTWAWWISSKHSWPNTRQMPLSKKLDRIYELEHPLPTCILDSKNMVSPSMGQDLHSLDNLPAHPVQKDSKR